MNQIPLFSRVRIVSDAYAEVGGPRGAEGFVVETYDDGGYEIEISAPTGETLALFSAQDHDIEIA